RVASVILSSLPRGERLVSPDGARRLARVGLLDRRAQANLRSRVVLGGYPPRAPTDPDVRHYRIRLVRPTVHTCRYTEWITRAAGSGSRPSSPHRLAQPKQPFQLRRESHFRQTRATIALIRLSEEQFPVTP